MLKEHKLLLLQSLTFIREEIINSPWCRRMLYTAPPTPPATPRTEGRYTVLRSRAWKARFTELARLFVGNWSNSTHNSLSLIQETVVAEEKSNKEENIYLMSLPCVLANSLIIYSFCWAAPFTWWWWDPGKFPQSSMTALEEMEGRIRAEHPFLKMNGTCKHRSWTSSVLEVEAEKAWIILYL